MANWARRERHHQYSRPGDDEIKYVDHYESNPGAKTAWERVAEVYPTISGEQVAFGLFFGLVCRPKIVNNAEAAALGPCEAAAVALGLIKGDAQDVSIWSSATTAGG